MTSDDTVTQHMRDRIWEEMWDIARHTHYYELHTNRLRLWNRLVRFLSIVVAATAVSVAVSDVVPHWLGISGAVFFLLLTAIDLIWDWGERAALSHAITLECSVIEKDYEFLFTQVRTNSVGEQEAQARLNQLVMRSIAATSLLTDTDRGLNRKAQKAATKIMNQRWEGGTGDTRTTAGARA